MEYVVIWIETFELVIECECSGWFIGIIYLNYLIVGMNVWLRYLNR